MKLWKVLAKNSHVYTSHIKRRNGGMELYEFQSRSPSRSETTSSRFSEESMNDNNHTQTFMTTVSLNKRPGEALGIAVASGSSDLETIPSIVSLRPGSVALTSDQLAPGDRIFGVNGINTSRMRAEDVISLLDNIDGNASIDIEYTLPQYASQSSLCVMSKVTDVVVERIEGSLGLTLRGGVNHDQPHLSRPFVVTHIRPYGPAHRTGLIRVGDRLFKVDNHPLSNKTLLEAQQVLKEQCFPNKMAPSSSVTTLTIEYDVNVMESVKYANGPLLVEIEPSDNDLGLILTDYCDFEPDEILPAGVYIEQIIPGSTSDRCGALSVGDQLLAIDDTTLDDWTGSPRDAEQLLKGATKLQILPAHTVQRPSSTNFNKTSGIYQGSPSISGFSTINSRRSRGRNNRYNRKSSLSKSFEGESGKQIVNSFCTSPGTRGVCHSETLYTTLIADRGQGYGLSLAVGEHSDNRPLDILIGRIANDSPAYRCGCLQIGDRITSVNHQSNLTLQEINNILEMGTDPNNINKIFLQVEFDVVDTIVPSSGIFTVKLPKRGPGLGITITASKTHPDEPFIISEIQRGSIAHRTGTLHAGDRLLSIDNRTLNNVNFESNFDIFQCSPNDIVTLKIEKTETDNANLFLDCVVYTVELTRYGGPLGITISGSEDCQEPIILSRLTEGGLAEKTGALHTGDRILAINGESLEHRPLSDAIRLLQTSGDRVQLKIARHLNPKIANISSDQKRSSYSSPGLASIDSAVHSWDSHISENNAEVNADQTENIKDVESIISEPLSLQETIHAIKDRKSKNDGQLQFYSDTEDTFCPSPLPLPNYNFGNTLKYETNMYSQNKSNNFMERLPGTYSSESILGHEIHHITLFKDSIYDDYGFSVSDGLYEKGVYVNRIRKGGPADIVGLLKPYDRILQVNDTCTQEFDCCLTVPLIASAGDRIELIISRNPYLSRNSEKDIHQFSWGSDEQEILSNRQIFSVSQNTITKIL